MFLSHHGELYIAADVVEMVRGVIKFFSSMGPDHRICH
jgi:hypothetical protein